MKQFDPNKHYCRRDGKPAKIVHTYISNLRAGQHLVVTEDDYYCTHNNGRCYSNDESNRDLVNIPEKIEGWLNVYKIGGKYTGGNIVSNNKTAVENMGDGIVACIKVSFTEGEGLDDNQP